MSTPVTPRRSGRQRKTKARYEDQVEWTHDTVRLLRADSDSSDRSSESSHPESVHNSQDKDFDNIEMYLADNTNQGTLSIDTPIDDEISTAPGTPTPDPPHLNIENEGADVRSNWRPRAYHRPRTREWAKEKGLRSRMLQEGAVAEKLRGPKNRVYVENYGPELEDLYPILRSRDVWHLKARNVVLPSRASISEALHLDLQGEYLVVKDIEHRDQGKVLSEGDSSYQLNTDRYKTSSQVLKALDINKAVSKKYVDNENHNEVVLGPWDYGVKYDISLLKPFYITEAYLPFRDLPMQSIETAARNGEEFHRGWLINLGARPQCLAWAGCEMNTQFLAVAFTSSEAQRGMLSPRTTKIAPAFSTSPRYPSHIQILKVTAVTGTQDDSAKLSSDQGSAPHLHQLLCTDFGNIVNLEWLPQSLKTSSSDIHRHLAVLSSDGCIRLLAVDLSLNGIREVSTPLCLLNPPPQTVFTCFCLPSHEDLIAGDSAGAVHLFNLKEGSSTTNLEACTTFQIHHTYIMNIIVATDYPHYLCSTSAGGEMILTDLRNPHQDQVTVHKSRLPTRNLTYYPFTRCFLTTTDAAGNSETTGTSMSSVVGHNLRHFYTTTTLLKLPECSGITTILATSPFHPIILVANASGSVFASNVIRRLMPSGWKGQGEGAATYMMKLYEVDWMELKADKAGNDSTGYAEQGSDTHDVNMEEASIAEHLNDHGSQQSNGERSTPFEASNSSQTLDNPDSHPFESDHGPIDLYHGPVIRPGLTRFHEGFQPERAELGNFGYLKAKSTPGKGSASSQIILPEEQAVTAMAWNPNGRFSAWCAIGWGSGLIVVRDLAHNTV